MSYDSNVANALKKGATDTYFRRMSVEGLQQIGTQAEEAGFVNRETVSCDEVSEFFHDADASSVGGTRVVDSVDGTPTFVGDISSYGSGSKSSWYKGNVIQGLRRPFACDRCSYSATTSGNLRRHQLIHTEVRQFQCSVCAAKFRQKTHLMRHVKYKHQEKDIHHQCAEVNPDVKVHLQQQQEIADDHAQAPLICADCDFSAMSREELKQHETLHGGGSEVKQCFFVTDDKSRLNRHLIPRPFSCTLCDYRATQKEHLVRHMKAKHGEESTDERQRRVQSAHETIPRDDNTEQLAPENG